MIIKKSIILPSLFLVPVLFSPLAVVSCSEYVDQKYIDNFYKQMVNPNKVWTGNTEVFASSVYNLETFRSVFKDQLPTDAELLAKGYKMELGNINPIDNIGKSNYRVYLKNSKTNRTYLPTPTKIDKNNKVRIVDFEISGFRKSTLLEDQEYENAYKQVQDNYPLNNNGKNFFTEHNIETNLSFNDEQEVNYLGKMFDMNFILGFKVSGFEKISADDSSKIIKVRLFLQETKTNQARTKGPGKVIQLSLK